MLFCGGLVAAAGACVGDDPRTVATPEADSSIEASSIGPSDGSAADASAVKEPAKDAADAANEAPPFNPAKVAGLVLWLDAQDSATFTTNGGKIAAWADKSSATNDALAIPAAGSEPARVASAALGKQVVRFTGGDQALAVADDFSLYFQSTDDFLIAVVASYTSAASSGAFIAKTNFPTNDKGFFLTTFGTGKVCFAIDAACGEFPVTPGAFHRFIARRTAAGTRTSTLVDGVELSVRTIEPPVDVSMPGKALLIGAGRKSGTTITEGLNGDIAEVLVYHAAPTGPGLSAKQVAEIDAYLVSKWGL